MITFWSFPTRVCFGAGAVQRTAEEVERLDGSRVLIVTDAGVERTGLLGPILASLEAAKLPYSVFAGVQPNPAEADVAEGVDAAREANADVLVAVGGGSPIDAAKLIATRLATGYPFEELDDAKGGDRLIPEPLVPIVAIPTTAGTGSEVGRSGVITLASTSRKTVIFSPALLPRVAILDPEMTRTLPAATTAATGFDALTHCLEAYVAQGDHPMADGIALEGLRLVSASLEQAVRNGDDLDARGDMLKAAMMGAVAFQKGLGACHSLAHPLSSEYGLHHGLANALCLPAVVRFNLAHAEERYDRVARLFGAREANELPTVLAEFRARLGLPQGLASVGIERDRLRRLASLAVLDGCHTLNPRECQQDDLLRLYEESL